jgi:hypothetical protein
VYQKPVANDIFICKATLLVIIELFSTFQSYDMVQSSASDYYISLEKCSYKKNQAAMILNILIMVCGFVLILTR